MHANPTREPHALVTSFDHFNMDALIDFTQRNTDPLKIKWKIDLTFCSWKHSSDLLCKVGKLPPPVKACLDGMAKDSEEGEEENIMVQDENGSREL